MNIGKMIDILSSRQKRNFIVLFFLMLIGAFVELLGVGIVMPLVNVVSKPAIIHTGIYAFVGSILAIKDVNEYVILLALSLIVIYIVKNIYLILEYDLQYRFVYNSQKSLMERILDCYLREEYIFHVNHSPAELQRNIINDVETAFQSLLSLVQLLTEVLVCCVLVGFLLYEDLISTVLISAIFVLFILGFAFFYKKYSFRLGITVREASAMQLKWVNQSLSGIKELKVTDSEEYFIGRFSQAAKRLAESRRRQAVVGIIPRPILETVMICGLLIIMVLRLRLGVDVKEFIPTLSIFAVSAFRMLPSFNRITGAYNNIMCSKAAVNAVYEEIKKVNSIEHTKSKQVIDNTFVNESGDIVVSGLSFRYEETLENVLQNVNVCIRENKSTAIIGGSGAGKSTFADLLLGILKPTQGSIFYHGESIYTNLANWHTHIGYIPQTIYLVDDTIRRNIAFGLNDDEINENKLMSAVQKAQLGSFIDELPQGLDTTVGDRGVRLSGGQKQRIGIARALYNDPEILIMDEATSALDNETELAVMEAIERIQGEKTVIIIAHRLSTIKKCDYFYKIKDHELIEISYNDVFK